MAVTVPDPVPAFVIVSIYVVLPERYRKLALIVWFALTFVNLYDDIAPSESPSTVTLLMAYPLRGVILNV